MSYFFWSNKYFTAIKRATCEEISTAMGEAPEDENISVPNRQQKSDRSRAALKERSQINPEMQIF